MAARSASTMRELPLRLAMALVLLLAPLASSAPAFLFMVNSSTPRCAGTSVLSSTSDADWHLSCGGQTVKLELDTTTKIFGVQIWSDPYVVGSSYVYTPLNRVGQLASTRITSFTLKQQVSTNPTVQFDTTAFAKMTALERITMNHVTVSQDWVFPPSLIDIFMQDCGLTNMRANASSGALNITYLSLPNNKFESIPSIVFSLNASHIKAKWGNIDLTDNVFPPLTLSEKKLAKLNALIATEKIKFGTMTDFTGTCAGETRTVTATAFVGSWKFVVCVVPSQDDDDLVLVDDSKASTSTIPVSTIAGGSTSGTTKTPTTTSPTKTSAATARTPPHMTVTALLLPLLLALWKL